MNTYTLLALYPEIQEKLFQEIRSVLPGQNDDVTKEDINNMPYLDAFLKEAFRFFPVVPVVTRLLKKDIEIGVCVSVCVPIASYDVTVMSFFFFTDNISIPAGTEVLMDIWHMHRNKNNWKFDANKFNPENFFPENALPRSTYAYIPFSAGPRVCIGNVEDASHFHTCKSNRFDDFFFAGKKYGIISMKLFIIYMVRQYRLSTKLKLEDLKFQMQVTMALLNQNVIEIENRDDY